MARETPRRRRPRVVAGQRGLARRQRAVEPDSPDTVTDPLDDTLAAQPAVDTVTEEAVSVESAPPSATGPAEPIEEEPDGAGGGPEAAPWLAPAVIGSVLVVLAIVAGFLFVGYHHAQHRQAVSDARTAAAAAAARAVPVVLSYDYRTFDNDVTKASAYLSPVRTCAADTDKCRSFRQQYTDLQNQAVKRTALKYHARVVGDLTQLGVVDASTDEVTLLAFVAQTSENSQRPTPRVDSSRVVVTMRKVDGQWLVASLDPV